MLIQLVKPILMAVSDGPKSLQQKNEPIVYETEIGCSCDAVINYFRQWNHNKRFYATYLLQL